MDLIQHCIFPTCTNAASIQGRWLYRSGIVEPWAEALKLVFSQWRFSRRRGQGNQDAYTGNSQGEGRSISTVRWKAKHYHNPSLPGGLRIYASPGAGGPAKWTKKSFDYCPRFIRYSQYLAQ